MAVDDVIKAGRNMAKITGQVLDNSKTTTKALNKFVGEYGTALNNAKKIAGSNTATKALNEIVSEHGTALSNAKKIANSNTTTKSINNIVQKHGTALNNAEKIVNSNTTTKALNEIVNEYDTALNNAKKIANSNTSVPNKYDAKGNYQQALKKAKEIAGENTTNKALNNLEKIKDLETVLIPKGEELKKVRYASRQNIDDFIKRDNYKSAQERLRNNKPGDIGPLMDEIKTIEIKDSPFQNKFDFSDDGGPRTSSSGSGNGNKNTNTNSGGGNEGPNDSRSWKDYANDYFGGIGDTYKGVKDGGNFWDALESAHTNDDGSLRWGRIAGTYAAAAVGSRVISGGGLYKDRYGNSNIPGVPFI